MINEINDGNDGTNDDGNVYIFWNSNFEKALT
jgi:hypothetical protein